MRARRARLRGGRLQAEQALLDRHALAQQLLELLVDAALPGQRVVQQAADVRGIGQLPVRPERARSQRADRIPAMRFGSMPVVGLRGAPGAKGHT